MKISRPISSKPGPLDFNYHNTRLFPKNQGPSAYNLTGIASKCDWAIMTDSRSSEIDLRGDFSKQPKTVFLSMRSSHRAIPYFYKQILPRITGKYVLVSGSEDFTIPRQCDKRWRSATDTEIALINEIIRDDRMIHWFIENRDQILPKTSSLPTGMVFPDQNSSEVSVKSRSIPISERGLKMMCSHRVRGGKQWDLRRWVTELCRTRLNDRSTIFETELTPDRFEEEVRRHPFVVCATGGGLDPSPKAWTAIALGSIPIIKSSPLDDAYTQLPVVILEDWTEEHLSEQNLRKWMDKLAPYYENDELRFEVLNKLSLDYWWGKISEVSPAQGFWARSISRFRRS